MAEVNAEGRRRHSYRLRHRGRLAQVRIYLGKMLRMFVYENDWKVLPMAALIAALVAMVVRKKFFLNMEGDLMGAFALTCVAIWNGCFNSIQAICRERPIIKREHRSGMHISSYVCAHMIYQALLCLAQSILTVVVFRYVGVQFPAKGLFTPWLIVDLAFTLFLISYASDMLSLWISSLAHTTTTAMTVMPFVLIFQLVFSGGIFSLPAWSESISQFTISNYALKCIAAQADYNNAPMDTAWSTLVKLKDKEIGGTATVGQILDYLSNGDNQLVAAIRSREVDATTTVGNAWSMISSSAAYQQFREQPVEVGPLMDALIGGNAEGASASPEAALVRTFLENSQLLRGADGGPVKAGELIDRFELESMIEDVKDVVIGRQTTVGELIDIIAVSPDAQSRRGENVTVRTTVGRLMELVGEEKIKDLVRTQTAAVSRVEAYERTEDNILSYWFSIIFFTLIYALFTVITLEFIDKDKR